MPRSRTRGPEANYWPGFVDALTTLLLVIIFLLVVFVLAQVVLSQAISGKDAALDRLNQQVRELADLLDLERRANAELRLDVSRLSENLKGTAGRRDELELLLERMSQRAREFEERAKKAEATLVSVEGRIEVDRESVELRVRQLESLGRDIEALRALRAELEAEVALLNAALDDAKDRILVLGEGLADSKTAAERLRTARDELTRDLEERRLSIVALEAEAKPLARKLASAERDLAEARSGSRDLAAALADARRIAAALLADKETLTARSETLAAERDALAGGRAEAEAATARIIDQLRATKLLIAALRKDKAVLEKAREALGERRADERLRLELAEARGDTMADEAAGLRRQLGALRDRAKALEARLADERERTLLAQKELAARDVRLAELTLVRDQAAQVFKDAVESLEDEKALSERRRLQMAILSEQIQALRREIEKLSAALDLVEAKDLESQAVIKDLGRRLNRALAAKVEELARYRSEFFGRLKQVLGARRDVEIVGDRFVFQSEVLFDSGSDQLGPAGREQLARLARALLEIAGQIPSEIDWVLRVDGHTDNRPIRTARFPSNWELSTARAISVVRFLAFSGIPPARLAATGFAEFQPIDSHNDEIAYRRNRRIELKLTQR